MIAQAAGQHAREWAPLVGGGIIGSVILMYVLVAFTETLRGLCRRMARWIDRHARWLP